MPLAYGSLLGGLTTWVGTPPNLLISGALEAAGERPFTMFDFSKVGMGALLVGTLFVALAARFLLPKETRVQGEKNRSQRNLRQLYGLQERTFTVNGSAELDIGGEKPGGLTHRFSSRSDRCSAGSLWTHRSLTVD